MAKQDEETIDPTNVPAGFLAKCLGITTAGVSALFTKRIIRNNGRRSKYDLTDAIPKYISSLRGSGTAEAGERLKLQQERKLRLQNDKAAGELVRIEDAAEVYRQACLQWRAGTNALPRRLATQLSNETNPAIIQRMLADEFGELFTNMVGPLREYFANAGEAFEIDTAGAASASAPAKKKPRPVGRRKPRATNGKRRAGKVAK